MPVLTVVAKLVAKQESIQDVKDALIKLVEPTRCEEGCIEYMLHQDTSNPAVFIFYENWDNEGCLAKHKETEHYKSCFSAVGNLIQDKEVHLMTMLDQ